MKQLFIASVAILLAFAACNNRMKTDKTPTDMEKRDNTELTGNDTNKVVKTDEEWKKLLSAEQYYILREKGTERAGTGKYLHKVDSGTFTCAACGNPLFTSKQHFESHCGWPSFDDEIPGSIIKTTDRSHGMVRTEITCARCGGHLGHLFDDGPTETGMRYCVNSISVDLKTDSAK